jgi:cell division protein ZapA
VRQTETGVSTKAGTTEVRIFGATYHVRGSDKSGHLQQLADVVDGKMREVAGHVTTADTARVAILAALNLADELSRARQQQEGERGEIKEKVARLAEELSAALRG